MPIDNMNRNAYSVPMTPDDLIGHFGSVTATARALGVRPPSVSEWKATGRVPQGRQFQAEVLTDGALRAEQQSSSGSSSRAA